MYLLCNISVRSTTIECNIVRLWFYQFWVRRNNLFIAKREPKMLLACLLGLWLFSVLRWSDWAVKYVWNIKYPHYGESLWKDSELYLEMALHLLIVEITAMSMSRYWLLFFSLVGI